MSNDNQFIHANKSFPAFQPVPTSEMYHNLTSKNSEFQLQVISSLYMSTGMSMCAPLGTLLKLKVFATFFDQRKL